MRFYSNRKRGFTLIELLVVIAIIGMLSSVILASLNSAREKSRHARRLSDLRQIQTALEMYYNDKGYYPTQGSQGDITNINSEIQGYFPNNKVPTDPRYGDQAGKTYQYQSSDSANSSQGYVLQMINTENPSTWCWMSTSLDTLSPSGADMCK